jgi:hypothetical protein
MPIDKNPGESKEDFISRCVSKEIEAGKEQDQAYAICITKYEEYGKTQSVTDNTWSTEAPISVELESYTDYPEGAKNNAQRALDWAEKNGWGSCGTGVGKARANQLAKGEPISRETISRMAGFERHRQNKDVPYSEGCGGLMWDAWGGDSGISWAQTKLKELNMSQVNLSKISFDYDDTLSTTRGKEMAKRAIEQGDEVYIISARNNRSSLLDVADELRIPYSRVFATGSNKAKEEKVKELGINKHIDNNALVVRALPGVGQKFKAQRKVIFNDDFDDATVIDYIEKGFKVHIRSSRKIQRRDRKVWNKLRAVGLTEDVMVFGEVKDLDKKYEYDLLMTGQDPILERLKLMGEDGSKYKVLSSRRIDSMSEAFSAETELMKDVNLKFVTVKVRYTYEEIAGIPDAKSGSRPFCSQLMSTRTKMYSLEEISSLSTSHLNDMGLPDDVFTYRGGFYRNPESKVTTPFCRHFWRANVVIEQ